MIFYYLLILRNSGIVRACMICYCPQFGILELAEAVPALSESSAIPKRTEEIIEATEVIIKYAGYIREINC